MTKARKEQISLDDTPFYHCYVRCVRRAFLCGEDQVTGNNFDHRKQWLVSRLRFLSSVFAIDICAYAVMSNHYHVVLHVDKQRAENWTKQEVVERWLQLFKGNMLILRWRKEADKMTQEEIDKAEEIIEQWRARLYDIGWFMRGVNEKIARMANEEEKCKGRFWEGRFRSQVLLDDAALLSCMAYVDLNPIRAAIENDTFASDFTSIQQRLYDYVKYKKTKNTTEKKLCKRIQKQKNSEKEQKLDALKKSPLMPFSGSAHTDIHYALPFTREDYFDLVDMTGRIIREDKKGFISHKIPTVVSRLGINPDKWIEHVKHFSQRYSALAGSPDKLKTVIEPKSVKWVKGSQTKLSAYQ